MSEDEKSYKSAKSGKSAHSAKKDDDSHLSSIECGFGWQLDLLPGSGSSTPKKKGTDEPDFAIYSSNRAFAKDSNQGASRSGVDTALLINRITYQNFEALRDENLRKGTLFEDPLFPAITRSLYITSVPPNFERVKWLRPREIAEAPQFFVNGFSKFDVEQHQLSNCWFLASIGCLTMHPSLFLKVVNDSDQGFGDNYAGIFHFKFWDYGKWVDIVIDDRLPYLNGQVVGVSSSEKNEFWVGLLEKAYAKFYGSYQALLYGHPREALVDLTGGVGEFFSIEDFTKNYKNNSFKTLLNAFSRGSLIAASTSSTTKEQDAFTESKGIGVNHVYTVSNVRFFQTTRTKEEVPLIRLRDPWGASREWKGSWCDNSEDWAYVSEDVKKQIKLNFAHDGEFWMAWDDFTAHYSSFSICSLNLDSISKEDVSSALQKRWETSIIKDQWVLGVNAGGNSDATFYRNPQYMGTLVRSNKNDRESKCTLIVSLLQKHLRTLKPFGYKLLEITFNIYHIPNTDRMPGPPFDKSFFANSKIIGHAPGFIDSPDRTLRFEYPPGTYLIVPFTNEPTEGSFVLRVLTEAKNNMNEYDQTVGLEKISPSPISARMGAIKTPEVDESTQQLFLQLGSKDLEITWVELKKILEATMMKETKIKGFTEDGCRTILTLADKDHSNKLEYEEFKTLWVDLIKWKEAFKAQDKASLGTLNGCEIQDALSSVGIRVNKLILIDLVHRYGDKERKLNFEAFILCAIKFKSMIELFNSKNTDQSKAASFTLPELLRNTLHY